jgi:hypothetical protein
LQRSKQIGGAEEVAEVEKFLVFGSDVVELFVLGHPPLLEGLHEILLPQNLLEHLDENLFHSLLFGS